LLVLGFRLRRLVLAVIRGHLAEGLLQLILVELDAQLTGGSKRSR